MKRITAEIAVEQQKSNDISINIQKLKTKLYAKWYQKTVYNIHKLKM